MAEGTWNHWDVYRDCLFHLGYGYPLWHPFGEEGAVWLGDVGWAREGKFYPLFNSMRKEDDVVHFLRGVPRGFRPITLDYHLRTATDLLGHSATQSTPEGDFFVDASMRHDQPGATIRHQGAAVIAKPIRRESCMSRAHIAHYMTKHLDSWLEFASASCSMDPHLHPEDIIFVSGTTMTTQWAMAVYQGEDASEWSREHVRNLFYRGDTSRASPMPTQSSQGSDTDIRYHHGPEADGDRDDIPREPDQCLFIHYFKAKARAGGVPEINAAAGPHQIGGSPRDPPGACAGEATGVEEPTIDIAPKTDYDSVNSLLDYILEHSSAKVAVASDVDLHVIFLGSPFPAIADVLLALLEVNPPINVDKHGVGMVAFDYAPAYKPRQIALTYGPGSFTGPHRRERSYPTIIAPFAEPACLAKPSDTNAPVYALAQHIPLPSLYKGIVIGLAMATRGALQTLRLRNSEPLDASLVLALRPGTSVLEASKSGEALNMRFAGIRPAFTAV